MASSRDSKGSERAGLAKCCGARRSSSPRWVYSVEVHDGVPAVNFPMGLGGWRETPLLDFSRRCISVYSAGLVPPGGFFRVSSDCEVGMTTTSAHYVVVLEGSSSPALIDAAF